MNFLIDFETCSLKKPDPIQLGIVVCTDELDVLYEYESLIALPKNHVWDDRAFDVHKITKERLKKAPSQETIALSICGIFKLFESKLDFNTICYHANGKFDFKILTNLLMNNNAIRGLPEKCNEYSSLRAARDLNLFESYKLTSISETLGFKYDAHDALSDCYAMLNLMKHIKGRI